MSRTPVVIVSACAAAGFAIGAMGCRATLDGERGEGRSAVPEVAARSAEDRASECPYCLKPGSTAGRITGVRAFATSEPAGAAGFVAGGHGGRAVLERFVIGGGGYGFVNQAVLRPRSVSDSQPELTALGTGGFFGEFSAFPASLVQPKLGVLVGLGNLRYSERGAVPERATNLFVATPRATVEARASNALDLGIGLSYRIVAGSDVAEELTRDLSGWTGTAFFRVHP